jgi:putative phosphoesterase
MRIGVISDTHIPELMTRLPDSMHEVFKDLDIILHLGDICQLETLRELQNRFAITFAVHGENDSPEVRQYILEYKRVVEFGNRRIGMIHGYREEQKSFLKDLKRFLGSKEDDYHEYLLSQFEGEEVDCIAFGNTHKPYVKVHKGILLFNPGAAAPIPGNRPSVGILEVSERAITGKIVYL